MLWWRSRQEASVRRNAVHKTLPQIYVSVDTSILKLATRTLPLSVNYNPHLYLSFITLTLNCQITNLTSTCQTTSSPLSVSYNPHLYLSVITLTPNCCNNPHLCLSVITLTLNCQITTLTSICQTTLSPLSVDDNPHLCFSVITLTSFSRLQPSPHFNLSDNPLPPICQLQPSPLFFSYNAHLIQSITTLTSNCPPGSGSVTSGLSSWRRWIPLDLHARDGLEHTTRVGQKHTYTYIRCILYARYLSREIAINTVIYGEHIWFWPTLLEARTLRHIWRCNQTSP
jgi:hypothetical protein